MNKVIIFALTTTANSYLFMCVTSFWSLAPRQTGSKELKIKEQENV